ncbi:uncharacterized protein LOC111082159 [Drosophila obscura]|uniref:uncharacterized protein LOC111082159 n=1 Tax=Drosophila obscura TaxID=7282 RepID=UPI001BB1FB9D|nr:uncharacterized protein LOC111082159 [Drosophila obscura]XP_041448328.1 uncharacterized protein LOC111082159 [Drosophila obscura]
MSEHACSSTEADSAAEEKRKADGKKASGTDDACIAKQDKVRTSRKSALDVNEDCWRVVFDYLDVGDQLSLASSNLWIGEIFKSYANHRYKKIDESLTRRISDKDRKQLLQIVGEHMVSFEGYGDQELWLLRSHCSNLQNLKITIEQDEGGWDDLSSLKKVKSLHAVLLDSRDDEGDFWCTDFVYNLEQLPCLKKLKLEAYSYSGRGLYVLDQLESLELRILGKDGFNTRFLEKSCQTMKQLRNLRIESRGDISKRNFEILATNCQQLERLNLGMELYRYTLPYQLICQLPRLQHLQVSYNCILSDMLFDALINKKGAPLESLILDMITLSADQVRSLCNISTLKELDVYCDTVPLEDLMKLKNLLYLHISMPITDNQLLDLLKGLPNLKVIHLLECRMIDNSFVNSVRAWMSEQREQRGKIQIYLGQSDKPDVLYADPLIEINKGSLEGAILINKELGEQIQD